MLDIGKLYLAARRQLKWVVLGGGVGLIVALFFYTAIPKSYTASSQIYVDHNLEQITTGASLLPSAISSDSEIASRIELLRSARVARAVATSLDLQDNEDFMNPPASPMSRILGPIRNAVRSVIDLVTPQEEILADPEMPAGGELFGDQPDSEEGSEVDFEYQQNLERATQILQQNLYADRIGRSLVIQISYTALEPALSSRIVNAFTEAFVNNQSATNIEAARQASEWLNVRIEQLQAQTQQAAIDAAEFRSSNNLLSSRGELVVSQQYTDLNAQLTEARSALAIAEARADQISSIISDRAEATAANFVSAQNQVTNPGINDLRSRYSEITIRLQTMRERFGADHPQVVLLEDAAQDIAGRIFTELQSEATNAENEAEIARRRVDALRRTIENQSESVAQSNNAVVRLAELEQRAETTQSLYTSALTRLEELNQFQSYPVNDLRVISVPRVPDSASSPRLVPIAAAFLLLGITAGASFGTWREITDRSFRTGSDVETALGNAFIGFLPELPKKLRKKAHSSFHYATEKNLYSETLHRAYLAAAAMGSRDGCVIGVTSPLPGEDNSTVSGNMANLLADFGKRTLLIDGNSGKSMISDIYDNEGRGTDARVSGVDLLRDERTKLDVATRDNLGQARTHERLKDFIETVRSDYDCIVVDLPPFGPAQDANALSDSIDGFLICLEWGRTPIELTRTLLAREGGISSKLVGVVLSRTDIDRLRKYGDKGSEAGAIRSYQKYYGY